MRLESRATVIPAPYVAPPSQDFDGDDGDWSTFVVQAGTPGQSFRTLPSTASGETWVIDPQGCTSDDVSDCSTLRGVEAFAGRSSTGFHTNESSTWKTKGLYALDLENTLGLGGNGSFGFDTVALGGSSDSPLTVNQSIVASIADKDFFLGVFGLGIRPSSFSSADNKNSQTWLQLARKANKIPSLSYGYTAGAAYQEKGIYGNLVLGGYDSSRFKASDMSFAFSDSSGTPLTLGVTSIVAEDTLLGTASFTESNGGFNAVIDSTVSQLWMPNDTCDAFAAALGLRYDKETDLYTVNSTIHSKLTDLNPTFTFSLGNTKEDNGNTVNIVLPYGAFDLQASWPIYQNPTNYFPIRRSKNADQYTLGRALLQQAYIIVDYERRNFSINQATFSSPMPSSRIVTIHSTSAASPSSTPTHSSSSLSGGAIAGIVIGVLAVGAFVGLIAFWFWRRRRSADAKAQRKAAELDGTQAPHLDAKTVEAPTGMEDAMLPPPSEMEARSPMPEMESPESTLLKPPIITGDGSQNGRGNGSVRSGSTPYSHGTGTGTGTMSPLVAEMGSDFGSDGAVRHELESPVVRYEMEGDSPMKPRRFSFEAGE